MCDRFENTVVAQFYGHTHNDHFEIFYDPEENRPTNIGYITPSITAWTYLNPSYRSESDQIRWFCDHIWWFLYGICSKMENILFLHWCCTTLFF